MEEEPMEPTVARQSRIALIVFGGVLLALIVVAAVLASRQDVAQLDPESPEGVVQSYVMAVFDNDDVAAYRYFTPDLAEDCRADRFFPRFETRAVRVELDDTRIIDGEARVEVTIHESSEPLDEWQHQELFYLTETADGWRISEPPWPLYGC